MFVTADGNPSVIFQRALKARSLMIAEAVAHEIFSTRLLTLNEALGLVVLYASVGDDKAERASLRWLRRLLDERTVTLSETRRAVEWLDQGHALIIFPAGGVATARAFGKHAADFVWHPFVARLAQRAGVQTVAMFVAGQNSRLFHVVSQWSYPLRVALIFHETRRRLRAPVRVRVALPVAMAGVAKAEVVAVLRRRTYAMSEVGLKADDTYEFPAHIRF